MIRKIFKYGDPVLETRCDPVAEFGTPELNQLVGDMFETMYEAKGVGLAAPQIGLLQRLAVVDSSGGEEPGEELVLINLEIIEADGKQVGEEGCLSIPGFREDVERAQRISVRAYDVEGEPFEFEVEDLLARVILHEQDHLDGVLFLDHLSSLKRQLIKRKIRKLRRQGEWD